MLNVLHTQDDKVGECPSLGSVAGRLRHISTPVLSQSDLSFNFFRNLKQVCGTLQPSLLREFNSS